MVVHESYYKQESYSIVENISTNKQHLNVIKVSFHKKVIFKVLKTF